MQLTEVIKINRGITALIGGGGKTTAMHTLARELAGRGTVILTTSTHICASEEFSTYVDPTVPEIRERLAVEGVICVAGAGTGGKLCAPKLTFEELEQLTLGGLRRAVVDGEVKNGSVMAGQIAGMVKEKMSCKALIEKLVSETDRLMKGTGIYE